MDFETQRRKRMEALEEKKRRLDEMKRLREEKPLPVSTTSDGEPISAIMKRSTDDLVNSLLASDTPTTIMSREQRSKEQLLKDKQKTLSLVTISGKVHIQPGANDLIAYEKETQTEKEDLLFLPPVEEDFEPPTHQHQHQHPHPHQQHKSVPAPSTPSLLRPKLLSLQRGLGFDQDVPPTPSAGGPNKFFGAAQKMPARKVLHQDSPEEYQKVVNDKKFSDFLRIKSLFLERALDQTDSCDIIKDYTSKMKVLHKTSKTFNVLIPYEEDSLRGRPVMSLQWSQLIPELFLATYGSKVPTSANNKNALNLTNPAVAMSMQREDDSLGLVCVWSKDLHSRPEKVFTAPSPVLTALFYSSDTVADQQQLVIGGCYSGQILLWDMMEKSQPKQRSSMSGKGHKHPVYAMSIVNDAELVSVSTDGKLCTWDITRLLEPLTYTFLNYPAPQSILSSGQGFLEPTTAGADDSSSGMSGPLNVCAMTFEQTETATNIIFGTGSGQIYRSALPYKPNYPPINQLSAHLGLVTSVQPHPSPAKNHKNLLLTSSLDWTVKLWTLSNLSTPIYEFFTPSYDYVCDTQWSPVNPAIFVTITSGGTLSLWNLAKSTMEPVDTFTVLQDWEDGAAAGKSSSAQKNLIPGALNKFVWSKDGNSLLLGDSLGKVHFISINQSAVAVGSDEGKFEAAIAIVESRDGLTLTAGGNPHPNLNPPTSPTKRHGRE